VDLRAKSRYRGSRAKVENAVTVMERLMLRLPLLLALAPLWVAAEPEPWMHSPNPGQLSVAAGAESDCPVTPEDVRVHMEGMLKNAGIEAVAFGGDRQALFLVGSVECARHGDEVWVFRTAVEFDSPDQTMGDWIGGKGYTRLGIGDHRRIIEALMSGMESAIRDYKASNQDYDF
jgi:hypothetical protein